MCPKYQNFNKRPFCFDEIQIGFALCTREMTKSRAAQNARLLECLICGKTFPKGIADLKQHAAASTLLHYVSDSETYRFQHNCEKCGSYFSCIEHLEMHNTHCTCGKADDESVEFDADCYTAQYRVPDSDEEDGSDNEEEEESDENTQDTESEDRTMECFICGKLFPRGPIDLARHANGKFVYRHCCFFLTFIQPSL